MVGLRLAETLVNTVKPRDFLGKSKNDSSNKSKISKNILKDVRLKYFRGFTVFELNKLI